MNIAIVAQDSKKELMIQFCIAYCGVLAKHNLCATATTGKMIADATGLKIDCLMPGATAARSRYRPGWFTTRSIWSCFSGILW